MSFVSDIVGGVFGGGNAAKKANAALQDATNKAYKVTKESIDTARADVAPYREAGANTIADLTKLVNDPTAQADFIKNNAFYNTMAKDTTDKLMSNQAAKGKVGSGSTAEALQNSLMLLGNDLLNNQISNRMGIANLGINAANASGNYSVGGANNLSNLITNQGQANAEAAAAKANSFSNGLLNIAGLGNSFSSIWKTPTTNFYL